MRLDGFHHVALSVPDLYAAIAWYGEVLDFSVERRWAIPAAHAEVAYLRRDDMRIELFEVVGATAMADSRRDPRADLKVHGHKHVAFAIADYDACRTALIERGLDVVLDVGDQFGRAFFIRDPFGNPLEFVEAAG